MSKAISMTVNSAEETQEMSWEERFFWKANKLLEKSFPVVVGIYLAYIFAHLILFAIRKIIY